MHPTHASDDAPGPETHSGPVAARGGEPGGAHADPAAHDVGDAALLRLAVMRLARRLRQASPAGVTPSQLSALASIERAGECSLGELAAAERVQPPTMTRIVAALTQAGLAERRADPSDRRIVRIGLSDAGGELLSRLRQARDAFLESRLHAFDADERATLRAALPLLELLAAGLDGTDDTHTPHRPTAAPSPSDAPTAMRRPADSTPGHPGDGT